MSNTIDSTVPTITTPLVAPSGSPVSGASPAFNNLVRGGTYSWGNALIDRKWNELNNLHKFLTIIVSILVIGISFYLTYLIASKINNIVVGAIVGILLFLLFWFIFNFLAKFAFHWFIGSGIILIVIAEIISKVGQAL